MKQRSKGLIAAMVSSATFGMIPLFSIPAQNAGMDTPSVIVYRFLVAALVIFIVMKYYKQDLSITLGHFWRISLLALINIISAITLLEGYKCLSSGAATTIQFSYPIFTCIIMMLFFGERPTVRTVLAILLAVLGVVFLSGVIDEGVENVSLKGVALELFSGLTYAIYLILVPKMKLDDLETSKLTFWVFALSFVYMTLFTFTQGGVAAPPTVGVGVSLVMLGLIPTAVSNLTLVIGLRAVGSTLTSILGALEPLTAMLFSVFWFKEPFTALIAVGFVCIVVSVTLLILPDSKKEGSEHA